MTKPTTAEKLDWLEKWAQEDPRRRLQLAYETGPAGMTGWRVFVDGAFYFGPSLAHAMTAAIEKLNAGDTP